VAFGDVNEGSPSYQSVILTSSGTGAVTLSSGSVSGTGYTMSGVNFPSTLSPGATATLDIEFNPTTTGVSDGTVTLTSNSSTGTTATISLTGTGVAASYEVNLTWAAPVSSPDPVAGYDIYRAVTGGSAYQLLNSSINTPTSYTDTTVANSTSYTYYVVSVDAQGNQSVPSNTFTVAIP
jgi:fibronectin type 3 domain-containing protein